MTFLRIGSVENVPPPRSEDKDKKRMKSYYIESLGCAKNLVDSEIFANVLQQNGYTQTDSAIGADIVLVNSCAFLQSAMAELDEVLAALADLKAEGKISSLIVTGCVMNRDPQHFSDVYPEVDAWIPLKDFAKLAEFLGGQNQKQYQRSSLDESDAYAYLRISDGCNNRCSYCTIPSIRGCLQSVPIEDLVSEAKALAARGAKELIIIAQDTCSYGIDLYGRKALPELLERLHSLEGFRWLRLMYLHPDNFELEWLELYHRFPKLLPYFEIPVQHFSDAILSAMNRKKGKSELLHLFDSIRNKIPEAVLRSTLITGFPGESKSDYELVKEMMHRIKFLYLGAFNYSAEPGTPAFHMPKKIGTRTAEKRNVSLLNLQTQICAELLEHYVGQVIEVLIEQESAEENLENIYMGRAWFQAPDIDGITEVRGTNLQCGDIVWVEIEEAIDVDLFGRAIKGDTV